MRKLSRSWLAHARACEPDGDAIPAYIERDFRQYLKTAGSWRTASAAHIVQAAATTSSSPALARGAASARPATLAVWGRPPRTSGIRKLLSAEAVEMMREWAHGGGFSLNAEVRVSGKDRAGLERLLRDLARPVFAGERLEWLEPDQRWVYQLPKPRPNGQTVLYLTPSEFLDPLAV